MFKLLKMYTNSLTLITSIDDLVFYNKSINKLDNYLLETNQIVNMNAMIINDKTIDYDDIIDNIIMLNMNNIIVVDNIFNEYLAFVKNNSTENIYEIEKSTVLVRHQTIKEQKIKSKEIIYARNNMDNEILTIIKKNKEDISKIENMNQITQDTIKNIYKQMNQQLDNIANTSKK